MCNGRKLFFNLTLDFQSYTGYRSEEMAQNNSYFNEEMDKKVKEILQDLEFGERTLVPLDLSTKHEIEARSNIAIHSTFKESSGVQLTELRNIYKFEGERGLASLEPQEFTQGQWPPTAPSKEDNRILRKLLSQKSERMNVLAELMKNQKRTDSNVSAMDMRTGIDMGTQTDSESDVTQLILTVESMLSTVELELRKIRQMLMYIKQQKS